MLDKRRRFELNWIEKRFLNQNGQIHLLELKV